MKNKSSVIKDKVTQFILKQYDVGIWLGAAKDLFSRTAAYAGFISFILMVPTAYGVWGDALRNYLPWINFWIFALIVFPSVFLLGAVAEYKFIMPSGLGWRNYMQYKHRNLIRRDIRELNNRLQRIEELLKEK